MEHPTLDNRKFKDLLEALTERAKQSAPAWRPQERNEAGMVLAAIYAHYLEILLARLNQVPKKNFLTFLHAMGVSLLPPGAAQAPIIFTLAPTAGNSGFVPKGTQVATAQSETQPAVLFETEQDLTVVAAQLVAAFTIEPEPDRYGDWTPVVTGREGTVFSPFKGDQLIEHVLYVGSDPLFLMQRPGRLILTFQLRSVVGVIVDFEQIKELMDAVAWEVESG